MLRIRKIDSKQTEFWSELQQLLAWDSVSDNQVQDTVKEILQRIRMDKDKALVEFTNKYDNLSVIHGDQLRISAERIKQACDSISHEETDAIKQAIARVDVYHQKQLVRSWDYEEPDGTVLGQKVTPIEKVGLYVPGGKAAYPSSVIMNAVPAKVAGVSHLVMTVPTPGGEINELVLAAAFYSGVNEIYSVGGAQAVAALAYGTETIPKVDKIVGPGNIYVATAKAMVFGQVGIDMIAGPSEILIVADGSTDPQWIAMDLFSQAEHDEDAQSILISPDAAYLDEVQDAIVKLLPEMERKEIITQSLKNRGALIKVKDLDEAVKVANFIAPEHLELSVEDGAALLPKIQHAGAIFVGSYSSEALGDYCAGPNHVLPTSQTARFSSPLGVYDFQKRSSVIFASKAGAESLGKTASVLARGEGLTAHARAAEFRMHR